MCHLCQVVKSSLTIIVVEPKIVAATGAGLAAVEIRRLGAGLLALFCSELSAMEMRRTLYIISSTEFCTIPFSAVCRRGLFLFLLVVGVGDSNADATG